MLLLLVVDGGSIAGITVGVKEMLGAMAAGAELMRVIHRERVVYVERESSMMSPLAPCYLRSRTFFPGAHFFCQAG